MDKHLERVSVKELKKSLRLDLIDACDQSTRETIEWSEGDERSELEKKLQHNVRERDNQQHQMEGWNPECGKRKKKKKAVVLNF